MFGVPETPDLLVAVFFWPVPCAIEIHVIEEFCSFAKAVLIVANPEEHTGLGWNLASIFGFSSMRGVEYGLRIGRPFHRGKCNAY